MREVRFPERFRLELLRRDHPRQNFRSGQEQLDDWIATKAFQHQEKHLSVTKVLLDGVGVIAGDYTLATGQVEFSDLPPETVRRLPRRQLPVAVLAWLGIRSESQGQGLGRLLLGQALRDCFDGGQTFAFIAVILDCVDDAAKAFYQHHDFRELPGQQYRLFLTTNQLQAIMRET